MVGAGAAAIRKPVSGGIHAWNWREVAGNIDRCPGRGRIIFGKDFLRDDKWRWGRWFGGSAGGVRSGGWANVDFFLGAFVLGVEIERALLEFAVNGSEVVVRLGVIFL